MSDGSERVAKAIFDHMFATHERGLWDSDDRLRKNYLDCGRAAIATIREPTPEMIEVAEQMLDRECWECLDCDRLAAIFRAMTDEMLK